MVNHPDDAEGIVKDVFLRCWEDRGKIQINTSQTAYLYAAVRNSCFNYIKREQEKRHRLTHIFSEQAVCIPDEVDISDQLAALELENRIAELVAALPTQCRTIFKMSRYEEMSYDEIADTLGISKGTVKTQMFRALSRIKAGIADYLTLIALLITT
jgi:RNA polymerase sigma-70 factor (ECF subfamily)